MQKKAVHREDEKNNKESPVELVERIRWGKARDMFLINYNQSGGVVVAEIGNAS